MDWTGCEWVEVIPGKVSGVPLVKGTRIPADFVVDDFRHGASVEAIRGDFPRLTEDTILSLVRFAEERQSASAA